MVRGAGRFDGEEFRRRRQEAGLSQQRVAELVGTTRWQVIAYEQGRATPEPARLAALATAVGCAPLVLTGSSPDTAADGLADLRRIAGLTRTQAAAQLATALGDRAPASKWLLEQTENGRPAAAWSGTSRRAVVVAAAAQVYGLPVDVVDAAWPVSNETGTVETVPAAAVAPATGAEPEPDERDAGAAEPSPRRSKAHTAWQSLNDRQRLYLRAVFDDDQRAERDARSGGGGAVFAARPKADTWRWRDFSIQHPMADETRIQSTLKDSGIHDPGAGSSLAALERRGLLLVRHDMRYIRPLGNVTVVQVRMTSAGRASVRAELGAAAPRKTPKGLLSSWLFKQLAKVAAAEPEGLVSYELWGEAHVYLGVGYHNGRNPSRGYIAQHRPGAGEVDWRWHLTDDGRAHLVEHLGTYRQLYPDIPTDKISLP